MASILFSVLSRFVRSNTTPPLCLAACSAGVLILGVLPANAQDALAPNYYQQPTAVWKPVSGSTNWFESANWVTGTSSVEATIGFNWSEASSWTTAAAVPNSSSAIVGMPYVGGSATVNMTYTGTGNATYTISEIQFDDYYTLNLNGTSAGALTLAFAGRGAVRYYQNGIALPNWTPARASVINIGDYATLRYSSTVTKYSDNWSSRYVVFSVNSSTSVLDFSGSTVATETGALAGAVGSRVILNGGRTNANGNTAITAQNLRVGDLNITTTFAGVIADAAYTPGASGTAVIVGAGLQKEGMGNLYLTGANTYRGSTTINNGALIVNGSIGSGAVTLANAFLGGSGVIGGSVTSNSTGYLSPGAEPGTVGSLRINGNFTNGTNATYQVDLGDGGADLLDIGGSATINGTLLVQTVAGYKMLAGQYRILRATGGVSGTFRKLYFPGSLTLQPNVIFGTNAIDLRLTQLEFSDVDGLSSNNRVVAALVDTHLEDSRAEDMVGTLNAVSGLSTLNRALSQISPLSYRTWYTSAVINSSDLVERLDDRTALSVGAEGKLALYASRSLVDSHFAKTTDTDTANTRINRTFAGVDYKVIPGLTLGAFFSREKSALATDVVGGKTDVDGDTYGLRADLHRGAWMVSATAYLGDDSYDARRSVGLTGLGDFACGKTDVSRKGGAASVSRIFSSRWGSFAPYIDAQYLNWTADGFSESGVSLPSSVADQDATSLLGRAGVRWSTSFEKWGVGMTPFVNAGWRYEMGDTGYDIGAAFDGQNYSVNTDANDNGYTIRIGLGVQLTPRIQVLLSGGYDKGLYDADIVSFNGGISCRF